MGEACEDEGWVGAGRDADATPADEADNAVSGSSLNKFARNICLGCGCYIENKARNQKANKPEPKNEIHGRSRRCLSLKRDICRHRLTFATGGAACLNSTRPPLALLCFWMPRAT